MKHLTEIDRDIYGGGYDKRSINAHSERTYKDGIGQLWRLVRDLEDEFRPFQAYGPFTTQHVGLLPSYKIEGKDSFGETRPWTAVERMLDNAVGEHLADIYALDLIVTPDESSEEYEWSVLQQGLSGLRVEIWEVTQDHVDRGRWGSWIDEAGWYWQRMDVAQLHGPYPDIRSAQVDFAENRDTPGILHPNDRPGADEADGLRILGIQP